MLSASAVTWSDYRLAGGHRLVGDFQHRLRAQHSEIGAAGVQQDLRARRFRDLILRGGLQFGHRDQVAGAAEIGDHLPDRETRPDAVVHDRVVQAAGREAAAVVGADAGEIAGKVRLVSGLVLGRHLIRGRRVVLGGGEARDCSEWRALRLGQREVHGAAGP